MDAQEFGCHHQIVAAMKHAAMVIVLVAIVIQYRTGAASRWKTCLDHLDQSRRSGSTNAIFLSTRPCHAWRPQEKHNAIATMR
jgi:hypothetical protein